MDFFLKCPSSFYNRPLIIIAYLVTDNMPELWPGADAIFSLGYELSIGYVISFIFYILQVYLPEQNKKRKALTILKNEFSTLARMCYEIIEVAKKQLKGEDGRGGIKSGDVYFKQTLWNSNDDRGWATYMMFTSKGLAQYIMNIKNHIDLITNNSLYYYCGIDIAEHIACIQADDFLAHLYIQLEVEEKAIKDVSTLQLKDSLVTFEEIINSFMEDIEEKHGKIMLLNGQEKALYLETCKGKNLKNLNSEYRVFVGAP